MENEARLCVEKEEEGVEGETKKERGLFATGELDKASKTFRRNEPERMKRFA